MTSINNENSPEWLKCNIPFGFQLDKNGLFYRKSDKEDEPYEWVSSPIWVSSRTRNHQNEQWGCQVCWIDEDGKPHSKSIACSRFYEKTGALIQELVDGGVYLVPKQEQKLLSYLIASGPNAPRSRISNKTGWLDNEDSQLLYLMPSGTILQPTETTDLEMEKILFQPDSYPVNLQIFEQSGSLEAWQANIAYFCKGNPLLIFVLCVALSAPLLKWTRSGSGGFHFYGESSRGKTTAAQLAASVFGSGIDPAEGPSKAYIMRWNATANAFEAVASMFNDSLIVLDELGVCPAPDIGQVIYSLTGGQGKQAMNKSRNLTVPRSWLCTVLSTGELSLKRKVEENQKTAKAGQQVRIIDIPVESIISDTHNLEPAQFVSAIKATCSQYYGTASIAFIQNIINQFDKDTITAFLAKALLEAEKRLASKLLPPEGQRVLNRFALVQVAGLMAVEWGILPFDMQEIYESVALVFQTWQDTHLETVSDVTRGVEAVSQFIQKHHLSRFQHILTNLKEVADSTDMRTIHNLAGYYDNKKRFWLTEDGLKEACQGYDTRAVLKALSQRGFLHQNNGNKYKSRVTIDGRLRELYGIKSNILGGIEGIEGQCYENNPEDGEE